MEKIIAAGLLALSGGVSAGDYTPFVGVDFASERDSIRNDYLNATATVGLKGPGRMEYLVRIGVTEKEQDTHSRNIETRVKKSFDIGMPFSPYVAVRLGQKTSNADKSSFTHWATDVGLKLPVANKVALDLGVRYRDAFRSSIHYQSTRYHLGALYEIDPANVIGLRYNTSTSRNKAEEERDGWRLSYQHNF